MTSQVLPLEGVRVIEFVHMVMGPTCGMVLGDLGADVIKIEPTPEGRQHAPVHGSGRASGRLTTGIRRAWSIDLKSPEGMEVVRS